MGALEAGEYSTLDLNGRVAALVGLVHLALDGPSARAFLDGRLEEAQRVRKLMWEDAKVPHTPASEPLHAGALHTSTTRCTGLPRVRAL